FEHKSYPSKGIVIQLLKYMSEIWEAKTLKEKEWNLPVIIPLVIYHGKKNWNMAKSVGDMIKGYATLSSDVQKFIPNFEYLLYDLSEYSGEDIKGNVIIHIYQLIVREIVYSNHQNFPPTIYKAVELLKKLEDQEKGIDYLETFMRYVFSVHKDLPKKDAKQVIHRLRKTYPEGSDVIVTLAEQFIEEGKAKGKAEGKAEALVEITTKQLTKKFGDLPEDMKESISCQDVSTLENILDHIFDFEQLEDVWAYMEK